MIDRIVRLDAEPDGCRHPVRYPDIAQLISVMQHVTSTGATPSLSEMAILDPAEADAIAGRSELLTRLAAEVPDLVHGPLRLDSQYWTATGKPAHVKADGPVLEKVRFTGFASVEPPSSKPFGVGLFTSTAPPGAPSPWRTYLDLNRGSTLHPLPWHTWHVVPVADAVIYEVTTAADWADFVSSDPISRNSMLYPNWAGSAQRYDAVHMTLRAVVATQGLYFASPAGIVAPPYWDVESTLWLRWSFASTELIEVLPA